MASKYKYALVINGEVQETFSAKPELHPDLEVLDISDAKEIETGWRRTGPGDLEFSPPEPPLPFDPRIRALNELAASDYVSLRAIDRAEPVSDEWREYRDALRAIASSGAMPEEWPTCPQ